MFVSFVAISAVLCPYFKAMSLVRNLPKQGLLHVVSYNSHEQPFLGSSRNALPFSLCGEERCVTSLKETINRGVTLEDRYRRQARNFTTNVWKILDLKSSSEQIFSEN